MLRYFESNGGEHKNTFLFTFVFEESFQEKAETEK